MSLKAFHIFFITASVVLTLFFGLRQTQNASETRAMLDWAMGILSFAGSLALTVYLFWFVRKMRGLKPR